MVNTTSGRSQFNRSLFMFYVHKVHFLLFCNLHKSWICSCHRCISQPCPAHHVNLTGSNVNFWWWTFRLSFQQAFKRSACVVIQKVATRRSKQTGQHRQHLINTNLATYSCAPLTWFHQQGGSESAEQKGAPSEPPVVNDANAGCGCLVGL